MWWTGAPGKVFQRTVEGVGNVLVRPRDDTVGRRAIARSRSIHLFRAMAPSQARNGRPTS